MYILSNSSSFIILIWNTKSNIFIFKLCTFSNSSSSTYLINYFINYARGVFGSSFRSWNIFYCYNCIDIFKGFSRLLPVNPYYVFFFLGIFMLWRPPLLNRNIFFLGDTKISSIKEAGTFSGANCCFFEGYCSLMWVFVEGNSLHF